MNTDTHIYSFKWILCIHLVIFLNTSIKAQEPVSNFEITDIYDNTYNLYNELNQGKIVVLDFFSYHCSSCQNNSPIVDSLYQLFGSGESVIFWGIETSGYQDSLVFDFAQTYGISFPVFSTYNYTNIMLLDSSENIYQHFNINGTPSYRVICPDRYFEGHPLSKLETEIERCNATKINTNLQSNENDIYYNYPYIYTTPIQEESNLYVFTLQGKLLFQRKINKNSAKIKYLNNSNLHYLLIKHQNSQKTSSKIIYIPKSL